MIKGIRLVMSVMEHTQKSAPSHHGFSNTISARPRNTMLRNMQIKSAAVL